MFFMSRRVPDASQRDCSSEDSPPEPPTPSRDEVQRLLRRSDDDPVPARAPSDDCSEGTRPCREPPVHAVSPSWTTTTRFERLHTLWTLLLVFGGVPYVLPVTPLVCVLAYAQVRR